MIDYLRDCGGFVLQLFPCTILFIAALHDDTLHHLRKRIGLFFLILNIVLAFVFSSIPRVIKMSIPVELYANCYMVIAIFIVIILFHLLSSENITKKLFIMCLILFYATTQFMIVNFLITVVVSFQDRMVNIYSDFSFISYFAENLVMFPPAYLFMVRVVRPHLHESSLLDLKREFKLVIIVILFYFGLLTLIISLFYSEPWASGNAILIAFSFLICICALSLNLWILFYEFRRIREESILKNQMMIQEMQYQKINKEIENAKRSHHDVRHHMRALQRYIKNGNNEQALEYIDNITDNLQNFDEQHFCENFIINSLLCYYISWAQSEGAVCRVSARCGDISIDASDLTILLGNCLENAILSCQRTIDKKIDLKIGMVGVALAVNLTNSCNQIHPTTLKLIDSDDYLPISYFASLRSSGYGLKSIENAARKYGGEVKCRYDKDNNKFITRIILYPKREID